MPAVAEQPPNRIVKSDAAFRTISEVADELDVPQHVLRFWESRFSQIKPLKRGGGRRYYRPSDVQLLRRIRDLLYKDGYTIKGVQKLLRDGALKHGTETLPPPPRPAAATPAEEAQLDLSGDEGAPEDEAAEALTGEQRDVLEGALAELKRLRQMLRQGPH